MNIADINTLTEDETKKEMQGAVNENRNYFIFKHKLANGEIRTVEVYSSPNVFGNKEMLFSIIYDITAKTQLQNNYRLMISIFLFILVGIIVLLYINNKKTKQINKEFENFNILRKTFIDSYENLIYLKDENLKYIFAKLLIMLFNLGSI